MAIAFLLLWLASGIVGSALSGRRGFGGEARGNQERGCAVALERIRLTLRTERDAVMRNKLREAILPLKKNPLVVHFREAHLKIDHEMHIPNLHTPPTILLRACLA
jgi:hypothetical protein